MSFFRQVKTGLAYGLGGGLGWSIGTAIGNFIVTWIKRILFVTIVGGGAGTANLVYQSQRTDKPPKPVIEKSERVIKQQQHQPQQQHKEIKS